jgi:hypothetical protein
MLNPFESSQKISSKEGPPQALPGWFSSIAAAFKGRVPGIEQILSLPAAKKNRKKLIIGGLAIYFVVLGLIVMARYHRYHLKIIESTAASERNVSPLARAVPESAPAVGNSPGPHPRIFASPAAQTGSLSARTPVSAPPKIARRATVGQWEEILKKVFLGANDNGLSDQILNAVSVWTNARSGYYYCADSAYFGKLQPGSIMTQGDALQSGYQPKLGSKCH